MGKNGSGAPSDGFGIKDYVDTEIIDKSDKPYQSLEHCIALTKRRNTSPQKWYPISLKLIWQQYLACECWLKVVSKTGVVIIGKIYTYGEIGLKLYGQSMLIDGNYDPDWPLHVSMKESEDDPIIQVFVSNKVIADRAADILRAQING